MIMVITIIIIIERILLNNSSFISTAIWAPITDPIKADVPVYALNGKVEIPLLLKPILAEKAVIINAILFVPLATFEGKPRKIKIGSVIMDAPPAMVFIIETKNPTRIKKGYSQGISIMEYINYEIIHIIRLYFI